MTDLQGHNNTAGKISDINKLREINVSNLL